MKKYSITIICCLIISTIFSCQDGTNNEAVTVKPNRNASARRACSNSVVYKFVYPDADYVFDGGGCQHFYVHRGATRQFKVIMTNSANYSQTVQLRFDHPDNPSYIQYTVASITGGSLAYLNPVPGTFAGASIRWTGTNMPAFTTYEMVVNVSGVTGSASAENGVHLRLEAPCTPDPISDCDADENLHLILVN